MEKLLFIINGFFAVSALMFFSSSAFAAESSPWLYFPTNLSTSENRAERLAILSRGTNKTYTPAVYELTIPENKTFLDLSLWDAPTHEENKGQTGNGDVDYDPSGKQYPMELILEDHTKVGCLQEDGQEWSLDLPTGKINTQSLLCNDQEIFKRNSPGASLDQGWSLPLRIYGKGRLKIWTVWKNHEKSDLLTTNVPNTHNVFAFRSRGGTINLKPTAIAALKINDQLISEEIFRKEVEKVKYEVSVNWIFPYAIDGFGTPVYSFDLDTRNLPLETDLVLLDKDADAAKLYPPGNPPDQGVTMSVLWIKDDGTDGDPLTSWSIFDQTKRPPSKDLGYLEGEQNSYEGPSGDNSADSVGKQYIHWYRFPIPEERKSKGVRVKWHGFQTFSNAFGFAANVPVYGGGAILGPYEPPYSGEEDYYPPACEKQNDLLKVTIGSSPKTGMENLKQKNISKISYRITVENKTVNPVNEVSLELSPPLHTRFDDETLGKLEQGKFLRIGTLQNKEKKVIQVIAVISPDAPDDAIISTLDRFSLSAANMPSLKLCEVLHYLGMKKEEGVGDVNVKASRCWAFDYYGGTFECAKLCKELEPETKVTVQDTLKNSGTLEAINFRYRPRPLNPKLRYEQNSIRINFPKEGSGIPIENDGTGFPPAGGIQIPGIIAPNGGSRLVYFNYFIPDGIEGCIPEGAEIPIGDEGNYTPIEYETPCGQEGDADTSYLCIAKKKSPELTAELYAVPFTDKKVFQGSLIHYQLNIKNATKVPVKKITINGVVPQEAGCISGNCSGMTLDDPSELSSNLGELQYFYSVKVKNGAQSTFIAHPGHRIRFSGPDGKEKELTSNALLHALTASPIPTGSLLHDIHLTRKTVLNSPDGERRKKDDADITEVIHEFEYGGKPGIDAVYPYLQNDPRKKVGFSSYNYCGEKSKRPASQPLVVREAENGSLLVVYSGIEHKRGSIAQSSSEISKTPITFLIETKIPQTRPKFQKLDQKGSPEKDEFQISLNPDSIIDLDINTVHYFMLYGGKVTDGKLLSNRGKKVLIQDIPKTAIRAVQDGYPDEKEPNIQATNTLEVYEEQWKYEEYNTNWSRNRLPIHCYFDYQTSNGGSNTIDIYADPKYRWILLEDSKKIPLEGKDGDFVTALTSTAWVQTKFGHVGFGKPFWMNTPQAGDPNYVQIGETFIPSKIKDYAPANQLDTDFFIFSPEKTDPLRTKLGEEKGKINNSAVKGGLKQGFLPKEGSGRMEPARGEAYDREKVSRDYFQDLIEREVFGKVVRLNTDPNIPAGIIRTRNSVTLLGTVKLSADTIYYAKGSLTIGNTSASEVILDGGKARLVIEGNATIASNIRYARNSGSDLSEIPSVRLHSTGNIVIHPRVTDIELMMLSEEEFHSGKSDAQLRILGDVIAKKTFWERLPLSEKRKVGDPVNSPSEAIYEDWRKYLLPPPGDQKLRDSGNIWQEVHPGTGKPLLEEILK